MLTAVNRKIDEVQFAEIARTAYTGGLNLTKYWKNKSYTMTVRTFFSHLNGSTEAITRLQQSSARYYQRPDATHLELDSTRTTLGGFGGSLSGGKISGHFNFLVFSSWSSPGLEFNDIGYKPNADMAINGVWGSYREWRPRGIVNQYEFNGSTYQIINFSGQSLGRGTESFAYIQFKNYYDIAAGLNSNFNETSTTLLRGGPSIRTPGKINFWFSVESDSRKKFQAEYDMSFRHGFENSASSVSYGLDRPINPITGSCFLCILNMFLLLIISNMCVR